MRPVDSAYRDIWATRLPPSVKFVGVFILSGIMFFINRLDLCLGVFGLVLLLYFLAGFSWSKPWRLLLPLWWLFAALFVLQLFSATWMTGLIVVLRLATLLILASLITLTTPVSRMMVFFERFFGFLRPVGVNPAKVALAMSLTLRFIPVLAQVAQDVRETQRARGLEGSLIAAAVPIVIRTLKMSEDVAAAIEARGYDGD